MRKYEFTDETIVIGDRILKRIRAVRDFGQVKAGDLGGWIESEENLSHEESCWVAYEAKVFENARVIQDAIVRAGIVKGAAEISGNALITGSAEISDFAKVSGYATVTGDAKVYEHAVIEDNAVIAEQVQVYGHAYIGGYALIEENAKIYGYSKVLGNTNIREEAEITRSQDVFTASCFGNESIALTAYRTKKGDIRVTYDRFTSTHQFSGTLDEFAEDAKRMQYMYGNNEIEQEYLAFIKFLQVRFSLK